MLSVTSLVPRFLAFYVLTIVYRKLKTVIDILKKHERQPFPIYRRERKKLKPIQKRPIFTMLVLVSTLGFFFSFLFLLWYKEHHRIINIEPLQVADERDLLKSKICLYTLLLLWKALVAILLSESDQYQQVEN